MPTNTIYSLFILSHLLGAAASVLLIAAAFWSLFRQKQDYYKKLSIGLALILLMQIVSGSVLSLASDTSIAGYCSRIGIYMGIILFTEFALLRKMNSMVFPVKAVGASIFVSVILVIGTVKFL